MDANDRNLKESEVFSEKKRYICSLKNLRG